jgi:hypothetical protein
MSLKNMNKATMMHLLKESIFLDTNPFSSAIALSIYYWEKKKKKK